MLMAVQVFTPNQPPYKFLYGAVSGRQMSVLETLFESIEERRRSRVSRLAEEVGGQLSAAEVEEEDRAETKLLLKAIDKKLEIAGRDKRQTPTRESQYAARWNSLDQAAEEVRLSRLDSVPAADQSKEEKGPLISRYSLSRKKVVWG